MTPWSRIIACSGALVLSLSACGDASPRASSSSPHASPPVAGSGRSMPAASRALPLDTLDGPVPSCGLTHTVRYVRPLEVVEHYAASDTTGEYGDLDDLLCPDWPQGSDLVTVVTRARIAPLRATSDSAWFVVSRDHVGEISAAGPTGQEWVLRSLTGAEEDTTVVVRTPYGWRIAAPVVPGMHVSPNVALRLYPQLSEGARDSLRALVGARPAGA